MTGSQGPQGPPGALAAPPDYSFYCGTGFRAIVGGSEFYGPFNRDQIDMTNAVAVRFILTISGNILASGSYARAEYTPDGTNWYTLSGNVDVSVANGTFLTSRQGLPVGANGDYLVRILVFNAGTGAAQIGLRQVHLQFK